MDKYKNKYRIPSARAQWWNYGWNGAYFITICTQNRECYFGKIIETRLDGADVETRKIVETRLDGADVETRLIASLQNDDELSSDVQKQFIASPIGKLAETIWHEIPNQFQYAELGDFVVMPNHIHGILILNKPADQSPPDANDVETRLIASLHNDDQTQKGGFAGTKNPMLNDNISRIIRWYKGRCSFEMRKIHADFAWQSRFHDHIIRNDTAYQRISDYIINNPSKWKEDQFYSG